MSSSKKQLPSSLQEIFISSASPEDKIKQFQAFKESKLNLKSTSASLKSSTPAQPKPTPVPSTSPAVALPDLMKKLELSKEKKKSVFPVAPQFAVGHSEVEFAQDKSVVSKQDDKLKETPKGAHYVWYFRDNSAKSLELNKVWKADQIKYTNLGYTTFDYAANKQLANDLGCTEAPSFAFFNLTVLAYVLNNPSAQELDNSLRTWNL